MAQVIEKAVSQWGLPNGYILGEEAGGAFVAGLRYGEGTLYTKNAGDLRVFWQGPSIGFDAGGEGARTMMLVYNLPATEAIYERFAGIDGSAYFIGGFGMTALTANNDRAGADPLRRRPAARRQYRLSEVHAEGDLEPVLTFGTCRLGTPLAAKPGPGFRRGVVTTRIQVNAGNLAAPRRPWHGGGSASFRVGGPRP